MLWKVEVARDGKVVCGLTAWPETPFAKGTLADLRQAYLRSAGNHPGPP